MQKTKNTAFFTVDELTSSYTSLTAAPQGSSSGSIPPPGTIHWSGCRLLLTSITFQEQRPASSLCWCVLGDQNGMPKFKVPHHYRCLLAKCGANHSTGHVWKISHDVMPVNHYVWIMQHERGQDWASWTLQSLAFHLNGQMITYKTESKRLKGLYVSFLGWLSCLWETLSSCIHKVKTSKA